MKKLFVLLILMAGTAFSQGAGTFSKGSAGESSDLWVMQRFSPFSADSVTQVAYSGKFDLKDYDSVKFWVAANSVNSTASFRAVLEGTPSASIASGASTSFSSAKSFDSLGVAVDTTNAKLEQLKYVGSVNTNGAVTGRIKFAAILAGSGVAATYKDISVVLYVVGNRRAFSGPR